MTGDSDDEFGDGQSLEYNEDLETQLQLIESQLPVHHANGHSNTAASIPPPSDRAPATRRKIEHLDICLEEEVADDEAVDNLIGEDDQIVMDVLNAPASQSSRYEEDLVQQVTNLIPGATVDAEPTTNGITTESTPVNGVSHELMDVNEGDEAEGKRKKSLFERFRKRGFFSVTDLVAPSWCEVQFDYRLRSKSYLPVAARPDTITTSSGAVIPVNKVIAGTGEKIMRKGEAVHKKLEREIHPVEVQVKTESREDVWGLRFLNMLASLEALLTLGKCRELPVVGFIRGYMIVGVIDEITRQPLISYTKKKSVLTSTTEDGGVVQEKALTPKKNAKGAKSSPSPRGNGKVYTDQAKPSPQKTLFAFYRPLRSKSTVSPKVSHERTHMLYVSDSKTRAGGTMPKEENSVNGKMQLMLYKEMLDGMLVEGLRQHALEQRAEQRASVEADDEFQILDDTADDDVVCLDPTEDADDIARPLENGEKASQTVAQQCQKTDARISTTVDRFTWKDLFDHLSLDPTQPFTDGFLEQSRLLVQGNNLSATVAGAETLQQMTSCWAEYVSKLGLGTIDPTQTEEQIEEALEKEVGGRRIGRSEKLLTLVYRRVGTSKKKKKRGNRRSATETGGESGSRSKRGKRRKRGDNALDENDAVAAKIASDSDSPPSEEPTQIAVDVTEVENERLLQLAIAESLATPSTTNQRSQSVTVDGDVGAPEADMEVQDEPLPATLLPPEVYDATQQRAMQRSSTHEPVQAEVTGDPTAAKTSTEIEVEKSTEDAEGSIIGSQRFAYSRDLLSEHIDKILQFWTGSREPVGVSIENTTRCGWCEFEDGCEWRAAKSAEAANRNVSLQSSRRFNTKPACS